MKKEKYITQRKSKAGTISYQVAIPYVDEDDGKVIYNKSFSETEYGGKTAARKAAIAHRDRMLTEIRTGRYHRHMPTVAQLYKKAKELFPQRYNTVKNHDYFYRTAIKEYEDIEIQNIRVADVQASVNKYAENHTKAMTSKLLGVWKQIFRAAAVMELPVPDKTLGVIIPAQVKPENPKNVDISDEDFNTFIDALLEYHQYDEIGRYRSTVIWYMLMIAYYTGMRPSEIYALTAADIHLDEEHPYISVNKAIGSDREHARVPVKVKSASGYRNIPVGPELKAILESLLSWTDHEYLISDMNGAIFDTSWVSNYIHLVSESCGVPFNAYRLRHRFATDLQRTEAPRTVQDLMGHATFSMSMAYARSTEEDRISAVANRKTVKKVVSKVVSK